SASVPSAETPVRLSTPLHLLAVSLLLALHLLAVGLLPTLHPLVVRLLGPTHLLGARLTDVPRGGMVAAPAAVLAGPEAHQGAGDVPLVDALPVPPVIVGAVPVAAPPRVVAAVHDVEVVVVILDDLDARLEDDQGRRSLEADRGQGDGDRLGHG